MTLKRILFVDDEPQVLDGLRSVLRKQRRVWDIVTAVGGEAALTQLRSSPFDVIVSDMRMPGMDGAALLQRVKADFPGVIRIILSGHAEREAILRALPVSHQFLSKPCDGQTLTNVIQRACDLHALLQDDRLRKVIGGLERLPTLPRVYHELTRVMEQPEVSPQTIAAVLEQDPAMCAKLLQVVNSSYFGLAQPVASVERAVAYLGSDLVRSLALTAHVFSPVAGAAPPAGFSVDAVHQHCLVTAKIAKQLRTDPQQQVEAFTASLLHDIGKVVLALGVPEATAEVIAAAKADGQPMHVHEKRLLGVTHADVGGYLLGLWGLPLSIVEAVAYHHTPKASGAPAFDTVAAVQIADALVGEHLPAVAGLAHEFRPDPEYVAALGIAASLPRWAELAAEEVKQWNARKPA